MVYDLVIVNLSQIRLKKNSYSYGHDGLYPDYYRFVL